MELNAVGHRIKDLRLSRTSLSQSEFAHLIGLDRTYLCRVESGKQNLKMDTLLKICNGLGVSIKEFFDFKEAAE